jgi:hypothetical protein
VVVTVEDGEDGTTAHETSTDGAHAAGFGGLRGIPACTGGSL